MDPCSHFARNLEAILRNRKQSAIEFSKGLGIPKSTMQSIMRNGQTSLDTALYIAQSVKVPLSALTGEVKWKEGADPLQAVLSFFDWFNGLGMSQDKAAKHISAILDLIQEERRSRPKPPPPRGKPKPKKGEEKKKEELT